MDFDCAIQGTDYNPNYESLLQQGMNIIQTVKEDIEDETYEILEMHTQSLNAPNPINLVDVQSTQSSTREQNVSFDAGEISLNEHAQVNTTQIQIDGSSNVELGDFFKRPVLIDTYTWNQLGTVDEDFAPWFLYFNNPAVKKKLDNFHLVRCNLHLKFIINASPFYYGGLLASYAPLTSIGPATYFEPCPVVLTIGSDQKICGLSQRPHVWLFPQDNRGAEMKLPFFYPKNYLNANVAQDFYNMGTINLSAVQPLYSANSVVGTGVTIQVYAWATDVDLAGPTVALSLQSTDEYGQGVISRPASAIARYANMLSDWPIIGKFATATSLAAGATSRIASLFGFTNVPVIADVHAFMHKPNPNMATTDIGIPVEKLTLDSKNELSIDNRVLGLDLGDELSIKSIVTREAYIDTITWAPEDPSGELLWNCRVTPEIALDETILGNTRIQGVPMWMVSQLFQYWRGDIIFRFKIICTQYHRGRLQISWDPYGNAAIVADTTNLIYTKIVDITSENNVEFVVPYTQAKTYLNLLRVFRREFEFTALTPDEYCNGIINVKVLTNQTGPDATSDLKIMCFVRGAENLEFACPTSMDAGVVNSYSMYERQSSDVLNVDELTNQIGVKNSSTHPGVNLIHMGEHIVSLRQLLRRAQYHRSMLTVTQTASAYNVFKSVFNRMPLYYGWDPNGINDATSTIPSTLPFNFVKNTAINWVCMCFIGNRGSIVWHVDTNNRSSTNLTTRLTRDANVLTASAYQVMTSEVYGSGSDSKYADIMSDLQPDSLGGTVLATLYDNKGLHASVPFYSSLKFASNSADTRTLGSSLDDTIDDSVTFTVGQYISTSQSVQGHGFDIYCNIGTDFNPVFFLNVPILWSIPRPASV